MAKINMFLHDYTDSLFAIGDTFRKPGFAAEGAGLKRFDYVVANPMWNQDSYDETLYENDHWKRFEYGAAHSSTADWGWLQHIAASLNGNGRAAVVLDTGAVSRGSGSKSSNREKTIRRAFVEQDLIEGVVLLPDNLFYNTPSPGLVLVLNRNKPIERRGHILLVNAETYFVKEKPKNRFTEEGIAAVVGAFRRWSTQEKLSQVVSLEEIRKADYNLSPSLFVETTDHILHRGLATILAELKVAGYEREKADARLSELMSSFIIDDGKKS